MTSTQLYSIAIGLATGQFLCMYNITVQTGGNPEPERAFEHWVSICNFEMDEQFKADVWKTFLRELINARKCH